MAESSSLKTATVYVIGLCLLCIATDGSVIQFHTSPAQVKDGLSPYLVLRCSLNDTAQSSAIIGRRDVTRTQDNIDDVMSIVVMRNGKEFALVTHKQPALVTNGSMSATVTGATTVSQATGEQAYLQVSIAQPTSHDAGEYVCEVNGVNSRGHSVVFSTSVDVDVATPTIADLVAAVQKLGKENTDLKTNVTQMRSEISFLNTEVKRARHIEHGRLNCDWEASDWSGHSGTVIFDSQSATFNQSYDKPPVVFLSIPVNDYVHGYNIYYWVSLNSVTSSGFTMHCNNYKNDRHVWNLWVDWISFAA